jgi:hypothetical protein
MQYSVMFQRRGNDLFFPGGINSTLDGRVIAFGAPACKNNLGRFSPNMFGNGFARFFDGNLGIIAQLMRGIGIAKIITKIGFHRLKNPFIKRGSGGVIKINVFHDSVLLVQFFYVKILKNEQKIIDGPSAN